MERDWTRPDGLWDACSDVEKRAVGNLSLELHPFVLPIVSCYESGVQAPTLPARRHGLEDMRFAAMFLKRALTDLRTVWLVTHIGYTPQAATVAAALFEHALTVNCLAGSPERAKELKDSKLGDLPWKPKELSRFAAEQRGVEDRAQGKKPDRKAIDISFRNIYSEYKFLCKIKHPTIRAASHDIGGTRVGADQYVVMAAPDLRKEDLPLKAIILVISIGRCFQAVRHFALSLEPNKNSDYCMDFLRRMNSIPRDVVDAHQKVTNGAPLPFGIVASDL